MGTKKNEERKVSEKWREKQIYGERLREKADRQIEKERARKGQTRKKTDISKRKG